MWEKVVINSLLNIIAVAFKSELKKNKLRDPLREVSDSLDLLYADDPKWKPKESVKRVPRRS